MLNGGTSLSNGVGIIIELIRKNNSDYDFVQVIYTSLATHPPTDRDPIHLTYLVKLFAKYMPDFEKLLSGNKLPLLKTPFGEIEPLGFEKFKICELIAELLHCSNMTLLNEPNGEAIVTERDLERVKMFSQEEDNDMNGTADLQEEIEENSVAEKSSNGGEVTEKLNKLKIEPEQIISETNEEIETEHEDNDTDPVNTNDELDVANGEVETAEIYDETLSDSEATEALLRENPIPGDQLKISLRETGIIRTILEMFFHFEWNNFLHNVVFDIVQQIFNGPLRTTYNRFLLGDLLTGSEIIHLVLDGDKKCAAQQEKHGLRIGYMGHLMLIAEEIAKFIEYIEEMKISFSNPAIQECLNEPQWREYMATILADTRVKYNTVLGDFVSEDGSGDLIHNADLDIIDTDAMKDDEDSYMNEYDSRDNVNDENTYQTFDENENADEDDGYAEYSDGHNSDDLQYSPERNQQTDKIQSNEGYPEHGDKFTSYMSHHLGGNFNDTVGKGNNMNNTQESAEGDGEGWSSRDAEHNMAHNLAKHEDIHAQFKMEDIHDDEDYTDPSDDGQSYAKPGHPLYSGFIPSRKDSNGVQLISNSQLSDEEESSDDSSSDLNDDEEDEDGNIGSDDYNDGSEYSLQRTRSKEFTFMS